MSGRYRDAIVVVRTWPLGERDRLVLVFGRSHGKVRAVARGTRGAQSRLGGLLQPSVVLDAELWRGRELDGIAQAQLVAANLAGRTATDPARVLWSYELLDLVDGLTQDRLSDPDLWTLLVRGLALLVDAGSPQLLGALVLRALQISGFAPVLDVCGVCGAREQLTRLDLVGHEARCERCGGWEVGDVVLRGASLVLEGRTREGLALCAGAQGRRLEELATRLAEGVIGRRLRVDGVGWLTDQHAGR